MSGWLAIFNADGAPVDAALLRTLLDVSPYGPRCDVWTDGSIGLAGSPLRSLHGEAESPLGYFDHLVIAFDGRLDDRATLRRQLGADRWSGEADSDLHLIAAAYERWGGLCPEHLLGDFAFCIWDRQRRQMCVARDHFGVKPLYLARPGQGLVVSNVLRTVRRHPFVSDRLDEHAVGDFLLFGVAMDEGRTSFADIGRLPPAHTLIRSEESERVSRYWTFEPGATIRFRDPHEAYQQFAATMSAAVDDRLRGGPAGLLMSGGLDSSSVACTAKSLLGPSASGRLRGVTGVYGSVAADVERHYSTLVARSLGIEIDHLPLDNYMLFDGWDKGGLPPEPIAEAMSATTADMLARVAEHAPCALAGDGGDPLMLPSTLASQIPRVPLSRILSGLWSSIRLGLRPPLGIGAMLRRRAHTDEGEGPSWFADSLRRVCDPEARAREVTARRSTERGERSAAINAVLDPWWPSTFETYDPGATARPVVVGFPFFDVRLVTFAMRLPSFPYCVNKHLLRVAMGGRLPDAVRLRPKTPLAILPEGFHQRWSVRDAVRALETAHGIEQYVDVRKFAKSVRPEFLFTDRAPGTLSAICLAMWMRHDSAASAAVL